MRRLFWLFAGFLIAVPAYAQVKGAAAAEGACNVGNAENIGQHIIDWVLCGASFTNPASTLFGALSLVLNVAALAISIYMFLFNGFKWVYFTTQYGVPGGNNGKIHGGIVVLRTGLLLSLLAPIVGNGFSPIQVAMRNFTEIGKDIGDMGANATANYVAVEGALTNVDLQNIDQVTAQILASNMCGKLFDAHHQVDRKHGLIASDAKSVIPITTASGKDVSIQWTYVDPLKSYRRMNNRNQISVGICGRIILNIPDLLHNNSETTISYNAANDTLRIETPDHLKGYADIVIEQYKSLKLHIARVDEILEGSVADVYTIIGASVDKSTQDASLLSSIDNAHDLEVELSNQIDSNIPTYVADLIEANAEYRSRIRQIGSGAARLVNTTDNVVSPDCGNRSDLDSTLENEETSIEVCTPGESWQAQLDRQGFAALGLYYMVHLKINQKIIDLQAHLAEPGNSIPFYEDYDNLFSHKVFMSIAQSDASAKIYDRYYVLLNRFMQEVDASSFKMDFSAVENMGNTYAETENNNKAVGWVSSIMESATSSLSKLIGTLFVSKNGSGDLILNLMALGSGLLNISHVLFALLIGAAIASMLPVARLMSVFSKATKGKGDGGSGGSDSSSDSLTGLISTLFWATYIIGCLLFFGLPAIPLLKWVLEIQSWAIMMFLAFIYAPLWIMAHASITDDRFMAEHTQSGYGMVYELLLRPLLMVTAFYAMIKLMHIADIGFTMMMSYLVGIGSTGFTGLGFVAIVVIAVFTAIQLCFRCFDLISLLSDYVLARIGFGAKPLGDVSNDRSHSTMVMGSLRAGSRGMTNFSSGAMMQIVNKLGLAESKEGLSKPKQ